MLKYKTELEKYNFDNFVDFIKDLRHYSQHRSILPITTTMVIGSSNSISEREPLKQRLLLKKKYLLEWRGLSEKSKNLLENYPDTIELKDIFNKYQKFIVDFYKWIYLETINLYKKEINEFNKIN